MEMCAVAYATVMPCAMAVLVNHGTYHGGAHVPWYMPQQFWCAMAHATAVPVCHGTCNGSPRVPWHFV